MLDIVLICFLGMPLEHLVVQLDRLDETGNCIFDMMVDETNPIKMASAEMCKLCFSGASGPMSPVYAHFPMRRRVVSFSGVLQNAFSARYRLGKVLPFPSFENLCFVFVCVFWALV